MKKIGFISASTGLMALPMFASAQLADTSGGGGAFEMLLQNILDFTNTTLIPFVIGIGFLVFVWGMFQYFIAGGANDDAKEKGKSLMIYATLGFVLIIVFWGIINLLSTSTGLQNESITPLVPTVTVPS